MAFQGWPSEGIEFFEGLEADNSKAYWQAHKEIYDEAVKAPFVALSALVEKEFGPLRLFRPYRDVRFSKDKTPYKTAAAASTEGRGGTWFYVQFSAAGLYAGSGYYWFAGDQLERYRAAVAADRTGKAFAAAVEAVRKQRYDVASRDSLKRVPRGYPPDHPRAELLKRKGFHVGREFPPAKWLHTAAAAERIQQAWRAAAPVTKWLDKHVGPSTEAPPEPD